MEEIKKKQLLLEEGDSSQDIKPKTDTNRSSVTDQQTMQNGNYSALK